jgi:O-methyltransferase
MLAAADGQDLDSLAAAAAVLRRRGRVQEAHSLASLALGSIAVGDSDDARARLEYFLASISRELGMAVEATAGFEALVDRPGIPPAYAGGALFHLASLRVDAGDSRAAVTLLRRCLALVPDHRAAAALLTALVPGAAVTPVAAAPLGAYQRRDVLDPLPYAAPWPALQCTSGRIDIHTLAVRWIRESHLRGHYLEFGVGLGRSAIAAIRAQQRDDADTVREFFLFDSFEGLPQLQGRDAGSTQFHAGQFAASEHEVRARLEAHGLDDLSRVHFVPGLFESSLAAFDTRRFGGEPAAVVHVDVDLFESARTVLSFITPHLQQGTLLLFDDWNAFAASNDHGERAAVREWLARERSIEIERWLDYGWHGRAFILHKRTND